MLQRLALLLLSGLIGLVFACGLLTEAKSPRRALFDCRVAALEPVVGDVFDAEQLVRDIYAGHTNLAEAYGSLKTTRAEIEAMYAALRACEAAHPPEAAPVPEPGRYVEASAQGGAGGMGGDAGTDGGAR